MSAKVICSNEIKEELVAKIKSQLLEAISQIECDEEEVSVEVDNDGILIKYPVGEIYGYSWDYVRSVNNIFTELKEEYPSIGINGVVYEYETISAFTGGFSFHCESGDKKLSSTQDWQICEVCGNVLETETFYNSSQWDRGEGKRRCICSRECMLKYVLSDYDGISTNNSWDEELEEEVWDDDDPYREIKLELIKRVENDFEEYEEIVKNNKEILPQKIKGRGKVVNKQKELLEKFQAI